MPAKNDETIRLNDGRTLAYSEHGDLYGQPVIFLHGNPGSRLMRHPDESIAESLGIRIIAPDRPGYGLSDHQPRRKLTDFASDINQLADALQLDEFALFGVSAGGAYVASLAHALPDRLTQVAIISGTAPFDKIPDPYEGMNPTYVQAFKLARLPEWFLRPLVSMADKQITNKPDVYWEGVMQRAGVDDKAILQQPEVKAQVLNYMPEAIRQGSYGRTREAKILVSPWGFELNAIQTPINLWYWRGDTIVPVAHGQYLADNLPNANLHLEDGGGHFGIFLRWREILQSLLNQ